MAVVAVLLFATLVCVEVDMWEGVGTLRVKEEPGVILLLMAPAAATRVSEADNEGGGGALLVET